MDSKEAAELIQAISASLRANPAQFQIHVSVSNFSAQNAGGVGYLAQNTGGIGFNSNMGNASIQIANQQAGAAVDNKLASLLAKLDGIEAQFRQPTQDIGKLKVLAEAVYAETWAPGVIAALIAALLKSFGL